ncbi:bifunctional metallophosphatase/5'-nucleotidase [Paraferrimonas sedimenticola]|uniref:Bifunctional metallophosphatase/5'-nucleotidase n=1 Tax=Paraferrimonas sedimenticola TaxID=375674 RepID=A0AA37RX78_9GAMM|nr:bifunctional UDP-sugar hydrolase/5'-nucleotidase [Paraferrimonas sedimenticola]GLP96653.1 bifunctional metallophosphatase/5'-nucleotidase [Paraferrimonas sedimenticola]
MQKSAQYQLTLAHINDCHSHFEANSLRLDFDYQGQTIPLMADCGGYAAIAAAVKQIRQTRTHPSLFVHAGDCYQGTLYYSVYHGKANWDLMNRMGLDALVLGNHDMDPGNRGTHPLVDSANFPVFAGNCDYSVEADDKPFGLKNHSNLYQYQAELGIARYQLIPFHDTQLAIFGVTLEQMHKVATPDPEARFHDPLAVAQTTIDHLRQRGIRHIVLLSHLGLTQDRELASKLKGASVIVGGHSHSLQGDFSAVGLDQGLVYGDCEIPSERIPVLHAGKFAETLGVAELTMDADGRVIRLAGGNQLLVSSSVTCPESAKYPQAKTAINAFNALPYVVPVSPDLEISQRIAQEYQPALRAMEHEHIAYAPKTWHHTRLPTKSLPQGSELAPMVAHGFYRAARELGHRVDFALHNAGGVRTSLLAGDVSQADIAGRMLPFAIPLVCYQLQAKHLALALEGAINAAINNGVQSTGTGSFPYAYRLGYRYDAKAPAGQRLTQLKLFTEQDRWQVLDPEQWLWGVSSAYTASGKEGYQALQQRKQSLTLPLMMSDSFIQLLQHRSLDTLQVAFELDFNN